MEMLKEIIINCPYCGAEIRAIEIEGETGIIYCVWCRQLVNESNYDNNIDILGDSYENNIYKR